MRNTLDTLKALGAYYLIDQFSSIDESSRMATAAEDIILTEEDITLINLNDTSAMPKVTDVCWMDIAIGDATPSRIEISLFADVTPITAMNFKNLCLNKDGQNGYRGSNIFRVISKFSIQGGNIGFDASKTENSKMGRYGKPYSNEPFGPENYRILHDYPEGGVVSMMKDIQNKNNQDSRFFITTEPSAGWADGKYVAFGLVTKGMNFVKGLQVISTIPPSNYPETPIKIVDSGVY